MASTNQVPHRDDSKQTSGPQFRFIKGLLSIKATTGIRSPHFWIIAFLMAIFAYIYYGVLTAFHDVYVILFFYPLIYAALAYRLRGVLVSGVVFLGILLPHALLFSQDPYSLVRSLIFALFAFLVSGLGATLLNYVERQLEAYEEILSLNEELNDYIKRLQATQRQLIQAEKLNALGQLSAAIAHEINNPLSGVLVYTQLLEKKIASGSLKNEEALNILTKMEMAVTHCSKLVRSLLDFARQSTPTLKPISINNVIDQAIALVGHQAEMKKVKVTREEAPVLPLVKGDFSQLQQVFINLVVNAIQAMSDGGELTIRTALSNDGFVKVSIQDTGCGIPPENMDKLFTPFFSTKEEVKGVGLGLAVSYGIVERHGGKIEVQSQVGKGSTFTVHLPAYKEEAEQPPAAAMP